METPTTLSSSLSFAWKNFRAHPSVYIPVILITEALWYLIRVIQVGIHSVFGFSLAGDVLSILVFILISGAVFIGLTNFALRAHAQPDTVAIKDILNFNRALPLSLLFLLGGIIFLVGIRLWVLPGLFFLVFFVYAPYIASEKGSMPYTALRNAVQMSLGNIPQLFVLVMLSISGSLLYILLTLFVGLSDGISNIASILIDLVAMPLGFLSIVHFYKNTEYER